MTVNNSKKKIIILASLVIVLGIASFALLGFLISIGGSEPLRPATYPNEPGFKNAMIWFELAASKQEVFQVLGNPQDPQGIHIREIMDRTNVFDYCYMVSYSLLCIFIYALMFFINQKKPATTASKRWLLFFAITVSLAMLIGDAMENVQLLKLTKYAGLDDIDDAVVIALNIWTRVKWGAIFIYSLLMAFVYFAYFSGKRLPQALFVMAYGASAILGIVSISILKMRFLVEPASYLVALSWLFSIIHAGIILKANITAR